MSRKLFFGLLAVAAMTAVSCNKEIDNNEPVVPGNGTHTVVFKADQVQTKTSLVLDGTTYSALWTTADEANFHIFENGEEGVAEMMLSADSKSATFTATFADGATAPFHYTAILAHSYDNTTKLALVESIQTPAANNIDGAADILVAKEVVTNTQPSITTEQHFQFKRVVSINKMTLRGLEVGEKVTEVTISSDKQIAAAYNFETDAFDYTQGDNAIVLGYSADNSITNTGTFDVYFVCAPIEDATLSIEVKTEDDSSPANTRTYQKNFTKTISFDLETVAEFVANVTCCETATGGTSEVTVFKETFDSTTGTGGNDGEWSGNIATSSITADNSGWSFSNNGGGDACIKMGTGKAVGSATTPALGITATSATITFKAAAWADESSTISLSASGPDGVSISAVSASNELTNSVWGTYSAVITGGDETTTITFSASNNRFFLDEVEVKEVRNTDPNTVSLTIADNTNINASATSATVDITSNKAWTVTSNDANLVDTPITIKGTSQDNSFTVEFAEANTSVTADKVATLHVVAGAGNYAVAKDITITQKKADPILKVDDKANSTKTVEASATSTTFTVTQCNFDWDVVSVTVDGDPNANYTAVKGDGGVVTVSFPSNEAVSATTNNKIIVVTVGDSAIKTATCTITHEGETYYDPNKKYYVEVTDAPANNDWSGIYLLVSGSKAYNGAAATNENNTGISVDVAGTSIEADATTNLNSVTISAGSTSGKWYINGQTGYIGAGSSSGKFVVSNNGIDNIISYDEGLLITSGPYTLRYNADHFRYYTTPATAGNAVKLYKFTGDASDLLIGQLEMDTITVSEGDGTLTFSWDAPDGAKSNTQYLVYWNGSTTAETREDNTARSFTKSGLVNGVSYYIEVVAVGDGTFYSNSDKKKSEIGTPKENQNPGRTYTYAFTSNKWAATETVSSGSTPGITWTGSSDGVQLTSGQGVQISTGLSGITVTSSSSFTSVSKIVVTYCTNASKGAGAIKVNVGSGAQKSFTVSKPSSGGTTLKTCQFDYSTSETGVITLTVDCSANSIYINQIEITAN